MWVARVDFKLVEDKQKEGKIKKKLEKEKTILEHNEISGLAVLSYVKGLSEGAARVLKKHGIFSARLKYKKDISKSMDAIYKIGCKNCPKSYIGETVRPLYV